MKNISLMAIMLLATLISKLGFSQQQKSGIVFNRFLLPAMVTDTSKIKTTAKPIRLQDAELPKNGTLQREKDGALRLQQQAPARNNKTIQKIDETQSQASPLQIIPQNSAT